MNNCLVLSEVSLRPVAGPINNMFNFSENRRATFILNETTGEPVK
jgi:hypothetical protein